MKTIHGFEVKKQSPYVYSVYINNGLRHALLAVISIKGNKLKMGHRWPLNHYEDVFLDNARIEDAILLLQHTYTDYLWKEVCL